MVAAVQTRTPNIGLRQHLRRLERQEWPLKLRVGVRGEGVELSVITATLGMFFFLFLFVWLGVSTSLVHRDDISTCLTIEREQVRMGYETDEKKKKNNKRGKEQQGDKGLGSTTRRWCEKTGERID